LLLASALAACSSGSSSTKPPPVDGELDPGFTNPEEPIEKDPGYKIDGDTVYLDGEVLGTIDYVDQSNSVLKDPNGNVLCFIQNNHNGSYMIIINHDNPGGELRDSYLINKDSNGKWEIDWANSTIDHSWGVSADNIEGRPEQYTAAQKKARLKSSIKRRSM